MAACAELSCYRLGSRVVGEIFIKLLIFGSFSALIRRNMQATAKGEEGRLLERYEQVRAYTEQLCEPLEIEDYIPQPSVDVSPPKWNIAHTTWFFEEMILSKFVDGYQRFDPDFAFLFNSYYNSIGERTSRDHRSLSRPTVQRV